MSDQVVRHAHYSLMSALLCLNLAFLRAGGTWLWFGLATAIVLSTVIDEAAGDDRRAAAGLRGSAVLLDALLYATLPLLALNALAFAALVGSGDPLRLSIFGFGSEPARLATTAFDTLGGLFGLGLFCGAAGINVAHEFVHRTANPTALNAGRWLLAFSFDTTFAIEHVYGHHRHVATAADPATARRGEYVVAFAVRSIRDGNLSAFQIEADRLNRKGLPVWSFSNRAITWQAASLAILAVWWLLAGWQGVAIATASGIVGKFFLEAVNYIEHYGLVRVPGAPVEPRHSWNCYRGITNGMLYNLARHSHHHRFATKPFWDLEVEAGAPQMPHGYMTMIIASLIPPVWNRLMSPRLAAWDRDMANDAERAIIAEAT